MAAKKSTAKTASATPPAKRDPNAFEVVEDGSTTSQALCCGAGAVEGLSIHRKDDMTTKPRPKETTPNPKALPVVRDPSQTPAQALSRAALNPSIISAATMTAFQGNLMGDDLDMGELVDSLSEGCKRVNRGDLSNLEDMLVAQATTLQTLFASLARRAANQEQLRQYEAFMGLALKAQAQSRATISALVDLKFPRQATFVKQANIAHGPQQVNNTYAGTPSHSGIQSGAGNSRSESNKLLEADHGQRLDIGAQAAAGRANQKLETVG